MSEANAAFVLPEVKADRQEREKWQQVWNSVYLPEVCRSVQNCLDFKVNHKATRVLLSVHDRPDVLEASQV